jgi:hypothetical protein
MAKLILGFRRNLNTRLEQSNLEYMLLENIHNKTMN